MGRKKAKNLGGPEGFLIGIWRISYFLMKISFFGLKKVNFKSFEMWCLLIIFLSTLGSLTLGKVNYLYKIFSFIFLGLLPFDSIPFYVRLFFKLSQGDQYVLLVFIACMGGLCFLGWRDLRRYNLSQRALDRTGLSSALGETPIVKSIIPTGAHRSKVIVEACGVGLNKFEAQKDSLTASFRQTVESITSHEDKGKVVIHLCERDLPKIVDFYELYTHIKEPYSFIIGQSLKGPIVQSICSLPHLLVSGATGQGKSFYMRSTILSLLKSSPHLQLYLLDLKRGVEVKEFSSLPNVKIAKDKRQATQILKALVGEMNQRYRILEEKGYKSIHPKRDKMDLIVVCVDEAAVLFGKKSSEAKEHIGELARLARASGIHLILSTQKPVKEAIDTETLDNLPGRMTFRMISSAASNVAMGGNLARKLPSIKGRAMWTHGSEHKEVQAPYVNDESIKEELELINQEFLNGTRENFNPLLEITSSVTISQAIED